MTRETVQTDNAPKAIGPYAQAIKANGFLYTAGQIPIDPKTGNIVEGDIRAQTRQALVNLQTILQLADLGLEDVVKTTVMLTDWRHYTAYNEVYQTMFTAPYPARSTLCAGIARPGALIAIEAIAVVGAREHAIVVTNQHP